MAKSKITYIALIATLVASPALADYDAAIEQQNYQNQMQAQYDNMRQDQYQQQQQMQEQMQQQQDQINRYNNESPAARAGGCC